MAKNHFCSHLWRIIVFITLSFLISNIECQSTFYFNPVSPPVYPDGTLADGTMIKPFPLYPLGALQINLQTAGAPISELNLLFKAGLPNLIPGGIPLSSRPGVLKFGPWGGAKAMITLAGPFLVDGSSLTIENSDFTFLGGSIILLNSLKKKDIALTIQNSNLVLMTPAPFYVKMAMANKIEITNSKIIKPVPDVNSVFNFDPTDNIAAEVNIKNFKAETPVTLSNQLNNILYFRTQMDAKSIEVLQSEIKGFNIFGFDKKFPKIHARKVKLSGCKLTHAGVFNYLNVSGGDILISTFTLVNIQNTSSRIVQFISETNRALIENISTTNLIFKVQNGPGDLALPRFVLTKSKINKLTIQNWLFNNVKSTYPDQANVKNILVQINKPIVEFTLYNINIPNNYEVRSIITTLDNIVNLRVENIKSVFKKGYYDGFAGKTKASSEKNYNFITVKHSVNNAVFSNIFINKNLVSKTSFILIYNGIDFIKFSDINAFSNLVGSNNSKEKSSLITILQPKAILKRLEVVNSKFEGNVFTGPDSMANSSSCFTFNGKIVDTLVVNTEFINNRAPDSLNDNFDIKSQSTTLDVVKIFSENPKENPEKLPNISGNGGGFFISSTRVNIYKSFMICSSISPNLKDKPRRYTIKKDRERLDYLKEDVYKFKC